VATISVYFFIYHP